VTPRAVLDRVLEALRPLRTARYLGSRGVGQDWEDLAAKRLKAAGYRIRERNYRGRSGEIDFVAEENGVLCFIEVKGRSGVGFGAPEEAVTLEKQRRIARAAQEYVRRRRVGRGPRRFDVVAILESEGHAEVAILRGAFDVPDDGSRSG
jgi:putative endonuclease